MPPAFAGAVLGAVLTGGSPVGTVGGAVVGGGLIATVKVGAFGQNCPSGVTVPSADRTLKVGSGSAAHLNEFFCVPQARFLGVTPQDIIDYDLPTHPLKDVDIKRAKEIAAEL